MKPIKIITDYQKQFIEDNFKTMTDKEIGEEIGLKETWICAYRNEHGMSKFKKHAKVVNIKDEIYFNVNKRWAWL